MLILDELEKYIMENNDEVDMDELKKFFEKRTEKHINLVKKYCERIRKKFDEFSDVEFDDHDVSKYKEPEYTPYLHMTWKYKCKNSGIDYNPPKEIQDKMYKAVEHHVLHNRHHPEYWCDDKENVINKKDIDKSPKKIIDATTMDNNAIAEMVADWCAMSEEIGKNTPKEWADDNIGKYWKFSEAQKYLIYDLISGIWEDEEF